MGREKHCSTRRRNSRLKSLSQSSRLQINDSKLKSHSKPPIRNSKVWHVVKFLEDGVLQLCAENNTVRRSDGVWAKWSTDGRWYPAVILHSGGKHQMQSLIRQRFDSQGALPEPTATPGTSSGMTELQTKECSIQFPLQNCSIPITSEVNSPSTEESLASTGNTLCPLVPMLPQSTDIVEVRNKLITSCETLFGSQESYLKPTETTESLADCIVDPNETLVTFMCQPDDIAVVLPHLEYENDISHRGDGMCSTSRSDASTVDNLISHPIALSVLETTSNSQHKIYNPLQVDMEKNSRNETNILPLFADGASAVETTHALSVAVAKKSYSNKTKRVWDKKYPCCFCKRQFSKISRHFETIHAQEPEVAAFLILPKSSEERRAKIDALRTMAIFQHNCSVLKSGNGIVIPKKRPSTSTEPEKYLPCDKCFAFYSRKELAKHRKQCSRNDDATHKGKDRSVRARSALLLPTPNAISDSFKNNILLTMKDDNVYRTIIADQLILEFGEHLFNKLGHLKKHYRLISNKLRELGRLVKCAKEMFPEVTQLSDLLTPTRYRNLRDSVRKLAGFNVEENTFHTPSLALKLGMSVKQCAMILKGIFLEKSQNNLINDVEQFIALFEMKWTVEVTTKAHRTLHESKWNKPRRIALAEDIMTINKYLLGRDMELSAEMISSPSREAFAELTQVALCRTLILNRRRVGEIQYMLLNDFVEAPASDTSTEAYESLTPTEKVLVKSLKRIEIRGKKGRKVPVILTEDLQATIAKLIEKRKSFLENEHNPYLFPSISHSSGHYRADVLLKKFATRCGAKNPQNLTSTCLRKHIATFTQLLNLREYELDALAKYMGHDIRVHREYYRLSEDTMDLAKVGKLLLAVDKGHLKHLRSKNLDEISMEEEVSDVDDEIADDGNEYEEESIDDPSYGENQSNKDTGSKKKNKGKKRQPVQKRPWGETEVLTVRNYFQGFIILGKVPGKKEIEDFISQHREKVPQRSWKDIKYCVYNSFKKK